MDRDEMLDRVASAPDAWDFIVIGGGSTGLGVAIDAASRGYRTLLLEQHDFAKGTSSRSTKLVHGGVRYLQQGNISLVLEALKERGLLRQNAPHLVQNRPFVVPSYDWWESPYYGIGLKLYDMLAGRQGFGRSKHLSKEEVLEYIPTVETDGLRGGTIYYDGQFDDARLAINMAQTAADQGAALINYMRVTDLTKKGTLVRGVVAQDLENQKEYRLNAKVVVNATGVFTDQIRQMDDPDVTPMIIPSQGVHVVLDRSFLPGSSAIMVPHTDDGRVMFAIPWHDRVVVGTTDTLVEKPLLEPKPLDKEVNYILRHAARYLEKDPKRSDVYSTFAGLRPLVSIGGDANDTASIARDHVLHISPSGLVTIAGGKWTTYRKMAQDTVDKAAMLAGLDDQPCITSNLRLHGYYRHPEEFGKFASYGSQAQQLLQLLKSNPTYTVQLHSDRPTVAGEVVWAVRHEMARTVEDFLARRTRSLLLDARTSVEMAPKVAELMAEELGQNSAWKNAQVRSYTELAASYLPAGVPAPPPKTSSQEP